MPVATVGQKNSSLQDRIREQIEHEILSGRMPPGSQIDEKALAASFQASRTPVREALLVLAARGLVTIVPRSGIYVRKADMQELLSALEALTELETVVAGFATKRANRMQVRAMFKALDACEAAVKENDIDGYRQANNKLHTVIHEAGANPVLAQQIYTTRQMLMGYRLRSFEMPGRLAVSVKEHAGIVEAISAGQVEQARQCMREHIERGADAMVALLRAYGQSAQQD